MSKAESLSKVKKPVAAVAAVVAFLGINYESNKLKDIKPTTGVRLEQIYKPAAVQVGRSALNRVLTENIPGSITEDPDNANTEDVLVNTSDGTNSYTVFAMMHKKDGLPDASSTFEVLIQEHYGQSDKLKDQILIIDDHQIIHDGTWGAVYDRYSLDNQKKPKSSLNAEESNDKTNKDLATLAKDLANITLSLPRFFPDAPHGTPDSNGIIT